MGFYFKNKECISLFFCYNTNRIFRSSIFLTAQHGGIPKRLKGRAWKARRHVTVCEGSNPSSSAIMKCTLFTGQTNASKEGFFHAEI